MKLASCWQHHIWRERNWPCRRNAPDWHVRFEGAFDSAIVSPDRVLIRDIERRSTILSARVGRPHSTDHHLPFGNLELRI